jgi:hypothetical protein
MVQAMQILKDKPKISWLFLVMIWSFANGFSRWCWVISVIGQGFPKEFSDMIRLGLNRRLMRHLGNSTFYQIVLIYFFEQGNPAGINLSFAWNCRECSSFTTSFCWWIVTMRISDFVKKLINSDKEEAFFFKAKKYFVVANN